MVKKVLLIGGGAALVSVFLFGRDAASYVGTSIGWVKSSVKDSVPVEFEIDRARKMVKDLLPDIRKNMHVIAKEEVEVERLERQIAKSATGLDQEKQNIMRLRSDLESPHDFYTYNGRRFTVTQVKLDLANRFERYKTNDATLESLREIHFARTNSLAAARQKLQGMLAAKRQLEVDVENLEARLKMVEVAQTSSEINVDDSRLGRAKELITDLRTRLDVAERIVNAEGHYRGEIPMDDPKTENIVDQITEYFEVEPAAVEEELAVDLTR
jgi:chromosome segregation ATPase